MDIDDVIEGLSSTGRMSFQDVLKICTYFFGNPRIKGSHHIFKMPWPGLPRINLQRDGKMAKRYQVKQVKEALEKLRETTYEAN